MSVQKKRISKRRTRTRRAHHALPQLSIASCPKCQAPVRPHYACTSCGYYRGRDVLHLQAKAERKLDKKVTTKLAEKEAKTKAVAEKRA